MLPLNHSLKANFRPSLKSNSIGNIEHLYSKFQTDMRKNLGFSNTNKNLFSNMFSNGGSFKFESPNDNSNLMSALNSSFCSQCNNLSNFHLKHFQKLIDLCKQVKCFCSHALFQSFTLLNLSNDLVELMKL